MHKKAQGCCLPPKHRCHFKITKNTNVNWKCTGKCCWTIFKDQTVQANLILNHVFAFIILVFKVVKVVKVMISPLGSSEERQDKETQMSKWLTREIAPLTHNMQTNCPDIEAEKVCRKMWNVLLKRSYIKLHYIIIFPFTHFFFPPNVDQVQ